jgi:hypothetical protein
VKVWLGRFEVYIPALNTATQMIELVRHATAALAGTDPSLVPKTHTVTVAAWAELIDTTFPRFIRQFVVPPAAAQEWRPRLEFEEVGSNGRVINSVRLEAAADNPDRLYIRLGVELGEESPNIEQLAKASLERMGQQLRAIGLELPMQYA